MVKAKVIALFLCIAAFSGNAQNYRWSSAVMDGSRTGCVSAPKDNVHEALGRFLEDGTYLAPDGKQFKPGSSVAKVASVVHAAQPQMSHVKTVIAFSEDEMPVMKKESELSNWFVGVVMDRVARLSGKKVDVGICNFGGIRVSMPEGEVLLDDMLSMFPFKNYVVYLELTGSVLKHIFDKMAATRFQAIGGVEIVAENGKVTKALIGGAPIEDDRRYGVATISFLLHGGDALHLAENAENVQEFDVMIIDAVLNYIDDLRAAGKNISAPAVKHVTIK